LIALDEATIDIHKNELNGESLVIYDGKTVDPCKTGMHIGKCCAVPLKELAAKADGSELMQNTVALGAAFGLLDYPFKVFEGVIKDAFKGKKAAIIKENINAAREGYDYAKEHYGSQCCHVLSPIKGAPKRMVLTGNEAVALGAVKAGIKLYAAYPMTPASSILHTLAGWQERHNIAVKQTEDEVGTINMGVGAGFAGVRAMVGTSGGGFALMQEGISLAGITETPIVIAEVQRGGPGTGVPTFTEQADLRFVMHAGHGDFPKVVLAPGDVEDAFHHTMEAFNLAERFQLPAIIISDKYLGESHKSAEFFQPKTGVDRGKLVRHVEPGFERYSITDDGISPRSIPGVPDGLFVANSDEHDGHGYSTEEIPLRNAMMEKRQRKFDLLKSQLPAPLLHGPENADITLVSWGSTKGPILDAMRWLENDGYKVNFLQITHVVPFNTDAIAKILYHSNKTLMIEVNISGQMEGVIRQETGHVMDAHLRRYDGRPIYPEQVYDKVKELLQ
ncbi:2-oxoacid:acceptor oxidoreductase subunit alpha, partial [Candidatus Woesearchaeota archaeon]|nr:2-oxoacid:acceptor oxidoreductase subunit alpha [Candidatus Woesearchaeota archaeon]